MPSRPRYHRPPRVPRRHGPVQQSRVARGYDEAWYRLQAQHLLENPWCVHCLARKIVRKAQCVDHIIPFTSRADPRRLDPANCQSLCNSCHGKKTVRDQRQGLTRDQQL